MCPFHLPQVAVKTENKPKRPQPPGFTGWLFPVITENGGLIMNKEPQAEKHEVKNRIPVWLYPSTLELLDRAMAPDNCKSRSELMEKAVRFYAGYIAAQDGSLFLSHTLTSVLRGITDDSENRIARLLFKLAVEVSMMTHVLASGLEITDDELSRLRGRCVAEVKRTGGRVTFDDAVKIQKGV